MITKARKDAGFSIDDLSDATNIRGAFFETLQKNSTSIHSLYWILMRANKVNQLDRFKIFG